MIECESEYERNVCMGECDVAVSMHECECKFMAIGLVCMHLSPLYSGVMASFSSELRTLHEAMLARGAMPLLGV